MNKNPDQQGDYSHREVELISALRHAGGSARSSDLAKALDVSEETIRRTIKSLALVGALTRVHGGAYLSGTRNDPSFFSRLNQNAEEKQQIARAITDMVRDGMTVFLDVGSTTAFVAENLRHSRANLTVVTNSVGVAQTLANTNGNRVHMLGGELLHDERGTFGHVAESQARRYAYDLAIFSADAAQSRRGFLHHSAAEAHLAEVVCTCAEQVLVGLDHHKFETAAPHLGLNPTQVHHLVVDRAPGKKLVKALKGWGVQLIQATGDT